MSYLLKIVVVAFSLIQSLHAFGGVTQQFTIINHTNVNIACAVATWDQQGGTVDVTHWFVINDGNQRTLNNVGWIYCEQEGNPNRVWFSNKQPTSSFCVSGAQYINPIFGADKIANCNAVGGRMVKFWDSPNTPSFTETLNP